MLISKWDARGSLHHLMKYNFGGNPADNAFEDIFGVVFHNIELNTITDEEVQSMVEFFKMNGRGRLLSLLTDYIDGKITGDRFESLFHVVFREEGFSSLSEKERTLMNELFEFGCYFSSSEEDHKNHPGVYCTEQEFRVKSEEVYRNLTEK